MTPRNAVNLISFHFGWYACVRSTSTVGALVVGWLLLPNLYYSSDRRADVRAMALAALVGTAADTVLEQAGLVAYAGGPRLSILCPLWITALWVNFGTTLHGFLAWLRDRRLAAAILGIVAGPVTYFAAERLGAVRLGAAGYAAVGLEYALGVPLLLAATRRNA